MKHLESGGAGVSADGTVSGGGLGRKAKWAGGLFIEPGKCQRHLPGPSKANPLNMHHAHRVPGAGPQRANPRVPALACGEGGPGHKTLCWSQSRGQAVEEDCLLRASLPGDKAGKATLRPGTMWGEALGQCLGQWGWHCWQWDGGEPGVEH